MTRYRRSTLMEPLRRFCRAADLLFLLRSLRRKGRLPGFSSLRRMSCIEMGPGPMRLAKLKRRLFRQVLFFDISDFGIPDPGLRIVDLEHCADVRSLLAHLPDFPLSGGVLILADHCLEHVSQDVLTRFVHSIVENGFAAVFRVPNILSPIGQRNFAGDPTHRTSFGPDFRRQLEAAGFTVAPWIRWYRPRLRLRTSFGGEAAMELSEEIVLSLAPAPLRGAELPR